MIQTFKSDVQEWGWGTAWFNLRFQIAVWFSKKLIGEGLYFHVHSLDCESPKFYCPSKMIEWDE